ncbi:hypothetical protein Q9233_014857, partial [Columba guinea]
DNEGSQGNDPGSASRSILFRSGVCSTGVYHMGQLGTLTPWSTADLSETLPLPDQLRKFQEQLYHLRWSAKDVTEWVLQEGLKQAKLPGVTGRAVHEVINQALEKLEEMQVPMPDYALKSAGAAVIQSRTSPSLRTAKAKVFWYSLPVMDYMRSPELILEGSKEEHEEQGTFLGQFTFLATRNPSQTFQLKYLGRCIWDSVSGMPYLGCRIKDAVSGMPYLGCRIRDAVSVMFYPGSCI